MKRIIKISLILLLVGMAVIAAVPFLKEKRAEKKYENDFKKIQESVTEKKSDVNGLVKKNKDCIGYVEISGTTISYPVMQTKDNPDFYLNHDFNRNYSFYGTPFLDARCTPDSDNCIIYGHNINGRKMFGALHAYDSEEYYREHPEISFRAGEEKRKYQIVSVIHADTASSVYSFTDVGNWEEYRKYAEDIVSHSLYHTEMGDTVQEEIQKSTEEEFFRKYQFLTLSTCRSWIGRNARLLVVAARERQNTE